MTFSVLYRTDVALESLSKHESIDLLMKGEAADGEQRLFTRRTNDIFTYSGIGLRVLYKRSLNIIELLKILFFLYFSFLFRNVPNSYFLPQDLPRRYLTVNISHNDTVYRRRD